MRYWNTESPLQPCTSLFDCYVPSRSWALPEKKPGEWEWCLGGSSRFWRKIGAIHQILHLTNANAGLTSKGFIYEAANWETCEVQALLRVYQSASQLLYLTSKGHRPQGPHSIFWLVGHAVFSCKRKKKGEQRDEGRKERGTWRDWGWGGRERERVMEVQKGLACVPWCAGALHLLSARGWNCCLMGFSALWPPLSQHPSGGLPCAQQRASHSATQP